MRLGGFEPPTNGLEGRFGGNDRRRRSPPEAAFLHGFRGFDASNPAPLHEADSGRLGHEWGTSSPLLATSGDGGKLAGWPSGS
jgi:hypothetical protein